MNLSRVLLILCTLFAVSSVQENAYAQRTPWSSILLDRGLMRESGPAWERESDFCLYHLCAPKTAKNAINSALNSCPEVIDDEILRNKLVQLLRKYGDERRALLVQNKVCPRSLR